jgi:hypothetical protein
MTALAGPVVEASTSPLPRSDFMRAPLLGTARPEGYKEWHHFVIHGARVRLLINISLTAEACGSRPHRLVPRVVVVAHDHRWTGVIQRFDDTEPAVSADLGTLAVARNRITVTPGGYDLVIDLPEHDIAGEVRVVPPGRPSLVVVNNQPVGTGRLNWLFVPRLQADGWFRVGGTRHRFSADVAYHDHNWGHFRWGDDFGWTWGSVLPSAPDDPWSFVFTCMTDRRRLRTLARAFYVWHRDEPAAIFRDAAVTVRTSGVLNRPPDATLPPPMRLVLGGRAAPVPACVEITAHRAGETLHAVFTPDSFIRLAQPSEVHLDRSVVLSETSGAARVSGSIGGETVDFTGSGVFELLHG